jgi:hypothetical protein
MTEETSYKSPQGRRSGNGSDSVLQYLLDDLRVKDAQPAAAPLGADTISSEVMARPQPLQQGSPESR